jgi:transglutaminase-like putative cysteine protease
VAATIMNAFPPPPAAATARYEVRHETTYSYSEAVPICHNEIHLVPREMPRQRLLSNLIDVVPEPAGTSSHLDFFGNRVGMFTIEEGHRRLVVASTSIVEVDSPRDWRELEPLPWESLRDRLARDTDAATLEARQFTFDSPLVRASPRLASWAAESFRPARPWNEALVELTNRIHREFTYDPTATTTSTPVEEVFSLKRGVCQDFAHLQIACLRSLGLAARYVSGYISNEQAPGTIGDAGMVGADASHAWLACWGGSDGWLDVDPTNDCPAGSLHVTIGWGRDYADVTPVKGVCVGGGTHGMEVAVHVSRID